MSIVTKTGDHGRTSFLGGARVDKDDARVEFVGVLDELNSFLGFSKALCSAQRERERLEAIQKDIFVMSAEAAASGTAVKKLRRRIGPDEIGRLERDIACLEEREKSGRRSFVIPGKNLASSALDVARAVARRAERRAAALKKRRLLRNQHIFVYLNRVSDLLYLSARREEA